MAKNKSWWKEHWDEVMFIVGIVIALLLMLWGKGFF